MYFMDEGRLAILTHILNSETFDFRIHGFQNDVDVFSVDQFGVRTENTLIECDFGGYAPLGMEDFDEPLLTPERLAKTQHASLTWAAAMPNVPQTCYGIYVSMLDFVGDRKKVFAEKFREPQTIEADGDEIRFGITIFDDDIPYAELS